MSGFRDRSVPGESLHVSIKDPRSGDPLLCTSHQAFQRILISIGEAQAADLEFTVHEYRLNPFSPLHSVQVIGSSQGSNLLVSKPKPVPKPKLPFGLKMPTRPRQRKPARPSQPKRRKVDLDDSLLLAGVGLCNESDSDSDTGSHELSEPQLGSDPESESECDDVEAHEQVHMTAQEAAEEAQIQEVVGSHQARAEERGAFFLRAGCSKLRCPFARTGTPHWEEFLQCQAWPGGRGPSIFRASCPMSALSPKNREKQLPVSICVVSCKVCVLVTRSVCVQPFGARRV